MTPAVISSIRWGIEQRERPRLPDGPYAVAGLRRAGLAAVDALRRGAATTDVVAYERFAPSLRRRDRRRLRAAGVRIRFGAEADELESSPRPGALIESPGIPFDAPLIRAAVRLSIPVLDELELGWRISAAPIVAVTGTNGKTLSRRWPPTYWRAGLTVALAGNTYAGPPLSAVGRGRGSDRVRGVELSARRMPGADAGGRGVHQPQPRSPLPPSHHAPLRRVQTPLVRPRGPGRAGGDRRCRRPIRPRAGG